MNGQTEAPWRGLITALDKAVSALDASLCRQRHEGMSFADSAEAQAGIDMLIEQLRILQGDADRQTVAAWRAEAIERRRVPVAGLGFVEISAKAENVNYDKPTVVKGIVEGALERKRLNGKSGEVESDVETVTRALVDTIGFTSKPRKGKSREIAGIEVDDFVTNAPDPDAERELTAKVTVVR